MLVTVRPALIPENSITKDSGCEEFLRLCLSSRWSPENLTKAVDLYNASGFAWSPVIDLAQKEHTSPLMYRALRDATDVPPEILKIFYKDYLWWGRHNLLVFHELGKLLHVLDGNNISVILLKGVALAENLYDNMALRPLRDMDILVHFEDRYALIELLKPLNYRLKEIEVHDTATFEYENEIVLMKTGEPEYYLDFHWNLLDSMYYQHVVDVDWFWQTAVPVSIDGIETMILGPEAQILHLCSHLSIHHQNEGLLWFNDIAMLLHKYNDKLDWTVLFDQAVQFDLVLSLQNTLLKVVKEWAIDVPRGILDRLLTLDVSVNEKRIHERRRSDTRLVARRFYTDLSEIPGWSSRLRYALLHFFPSITYMKRRYDIRRPYLLPFYYPYRWLVGLASVVRLSLLDEK
jgi:hypothetical protein